MSQERRTILTLEIVEIRETYSADESLWIPCSPEVSATYNDKDSDRIFRLLSEIMPVFGQYHLPTYLIRPDRWPNKSTKD